MKYLAFIVAVASVNGVTSAAPLESWNDLTGDWFGARTAMEESGVSFEFTLTFDYTKNLRGGLDTQGEAWRHLFDAAILIETEPLLGWSEGVFLARFQQQHGPSGSDEVGDFQGVGSNDADGRTQLAELWYEQGFFEQWLRLKVGKIDANASFGAPWHSGCFLNSALTQPSSTYATMPAYPDPALGLEVWLKPMDQLYLGAGVYDGSLARGVATGSAAPGKAFQDDSGLFVIGEIGLVWSLGGPNQLEGRAALGLWGHTGEFARFDGGSDQRGTHGWYLILDQLLLRENPQAEDDEQGLAAFLMVGGGDEDVEAAAWHLGGGLLWTGLIPTRDEDSLGLAFTTVWFTDDSAAGFTEDHETTLETFYRIQATPFLAVQPDLQYVIHPGGDRGISNALVMSLRVELTF